MTDLSKRLAASRAAMTRHLEQQLVPFWLARCRDEQYGGYLTNFIADGQPLETPEKYLNTQCRLMWWFAALQARFPSQPGLAEMARHGLAFLERFFWDAAAGGWRWKVRRDGTPVDDAKIVYGQSFAIYALSEFARSAGDPHSQARAEQTFDLLQKYAADTQRGGYYENLEPDWSVAPDGDAGGDRKSLDTHMHLLEAFTALLAATGREIHRRKLLEVAGVIVRHMIDPGIGCGRNQFSLDFRPMPAIAIRRTWNAERQGQAPEIPVDTTSYGHNLELVWLMNRALAVAGVDAAPYRPLLRRMAAHAAEYGVDWEVGGIYRDGTAGGGPLILDKEFWQHAEALVGFLDAYEAFGEVRFFDAFEHVWGFVAEHLIHPVAGEWRTLVDRKGRPLDSNLGNPWKVAYHTGRAMLECTARLERLLSLAREVPAHA